MNTQPDRAVEPEDKPRLLLCDDCNKDFLSRGGKMLCAECQWLRDGDRAVADQRFEHDFARIFGKGRQP